MARARRADGARDPAAPEQQSVIVSAVGFSVHAETGLLCVPGTHELVELPENCAISERCNH